MTGSRETQLSRRYIATLALAAGLILAIGNWARPRGQGAEGRPNPLPQVERFLLDRLAQRGSLENVTAYFSRIAYDAALHLVRLPGQRATGVIWDLEGTIVAPRAGPSFPETVALEAGRSRNLVTTAQVLGAPPGSPLAGLRPQSDLPLPPVNRVPQVVPAVGEWVVIVWRSEGQDYAFASGQFQGAAAATCQTFSFTEMLAGISLTPAMAGGGLFDQDGRLLGVLLPCEDRLTVAAAESVSEGLDSARMLDGQILTRYGMKAEILGDAARSYFGRTSGAWVREVWRGYPADRAGLMPGDIIVRLDGEPVQGLADLYRLTMPLAREMFEMDVIRGGKPLSVRLHARGEVQPGTGVIPFGFVFQPSSGGHVIDSVLPGSAAARAGIRPGDRVVRVGSMTPRTLADVQRALGAREGGSRFLVIERGRRRWGALLSE